MSERRILSNALKIHNAWFLVHKYFNDSKRRTFSFRNHFEHNVVLLFQTSIWIYMFDNYPVLHISIHSQTTCSHNWSKLFFTISFPNGSALFRSSFTQPKNSPRAVLPCVAKEFTTPQQRKAKITATTTTASVKTASGALFAILDECHRINRSRKV